MSQVFENIDAYVESFPVDVQVVLERVRQTLHSVLPGAGEAIRYQIPTLTLDGRSLVHFAAWKSHLGLYPLPAGDEALNRDLAPYATGKGTANFPYARPIPYELIARAGVVLLEERRRTSAPDGG